MTHRFPTTLQQLLTATALVCTLGLSGCGGGGSPAPAPPPPPPAPATTLTLSATADAVVGGAPVALSATLNGAGTVTWQLASDNAGTLSATTGATVNYVPPATSGAYAVAKVAVTATSGSLSKTMALNLLPDPKRPGLYLLAGETATIGTVSTDGAGTAARFDEISGISADTAGNVYVTESSNRIRSVRKVAVDGRVTTLTSLPSGGVRNVWFAPSAAADGSVYFTERRPLTSRLDTHDTYKVEPGGKLVYLTSMDTTFNGHGGQVLASPDGRIYRLHDYSIAIWQADGKDITLAGAAIDSGNQDGTGGAARFTKLQDVAAAPDGTLFALDLGSVRQITPAGVVTTLASVPTANPGAPAALAPSKITVDGSGNVLLLYVGQDPSYFEIRKLSGGAVVPLHRVGVPGGQYDIRPTQMTAQRDGAILLARKNSVMRLGTDGKLRPLAGSDDAPYAALDGDGGAARYARPGLLAADAAGNIYSVEDVGHIDKLSNVIRKTTPAGQASTYATLNLGMNISGMAVTPAGQLIVSLVPPLDSRQLGGAVYQVGAGNQFTLLAGAPGPNTGTPLQQDGSGAAARFGAPVLAGADAEGNLYLRDRVAADAPATTVRKLTPQGVVSTVASLPAGLGSAPDGNYYRADAIRGSILRVTPAGVTTVVAGNGAVNVLNGATVPGPLPGELADIRSVIPLGTNTLAVATGTAILRVVLP